MERRGARVQDRLAFGVNAVDGDHFGSDNPE